MRHRFPPALPPVTRCGRVPRGRTAAFSLVELMIAIVILGLGMVMVATIFPVAWTRARALNEASVEQSVAAAAATAVPTLLRPTTIQPWIDPGDLFSVQDRLVSGGLLGDLFFDPQVSQLPVAYSDTRVHALHMSNIALAADPNERVVAEAPWALEGTVWWFDETGNSVPALQETLGRGSPFDPQVPVWERVYPPLASPPSPADATAFAAWEAQLAERRFAWAVLHRLRERVGPAAPTGVLNQELIAAIREEASAAMGTTRILDAYYVTLRRPNPTNRYARQDASVANGVPDPNNPGGPATQPAALSAENDLTFPTAWRVEVEFTNSPVLVSRSAAGPTGVASEVRVPRTTVTGNTATMLWQMFPEGTQFVDERNGRVYRIARRRVLVAGNQPAAILTLGREVSLEELDDGLPPLGGSGVLEAAELVRTVWVFPPPVDRENSASPETPVFSGITPVVNIDVRSLTLSPSL